MHLVVAILFTIGVILIGAIPFRLLYYVSNFISFILSKVVRYREEVIDENLKLCFPNASNGELGKVKKNFYRNLSDIFLEGIKAFTMTRSQIARRHKLMNPELIFPYLQTGRSIMGVTAHFGNWEWGSLSASVQLDSRVVAFYKKLNNKYIDYLVRQSRKKFGTLLVPINTTSEGFEESKDYTTIFMMAADQRTIRKNLDKSYWVNFLGVETPFLHGPEKYARLYDLPVFFIDIQRKERGFYEITLFLLADNPTQLVDGEITRLYANKLESEILKKPHNWLWSHRRWKIMR